MRPGYENKIRDVWYVHISKTKNKGTSSLKFYF